MHLQERGDRLPIAEDSEKVEGSIISINLFFSVRFRTCFLHISCARYCIVIKATPQYIEV